MNSNKKKSRLNIILIAIISGLIGGFFTNTILKDSDTSSNELNYQNQKIVYSKHAKCRMDCRFIDEFEILEVLKKGQINTNKKRIGKKGESYAIEGKTRDNQMVRVVVAPKKNEWVIVTVIDLEKNWNCNCD